MTETASKGGLMAGRRGLIMGVANERSIAWSVASALAREGAQLAFTYQFLLCLLYRIFSFLNSTINFSSFSWIQLHAGM